MILFIYLTYIKALKLIKYHGTDALVKLSQIQWYKMEVNQYA